MLLKRRCRALSFTAASSAQLVRARKGLTSCERLSRKGLTSCEVLSARQGLCKGLRSCVRALRAERLEARKGRLASRKGPLSLVRLLFGIAEGEARVGDIEEQVVDTGKAGGQRGEA